MTECQSPGGDLAALDEDNPLVWPLDNEESDTVRASVDPWLRQLGAASDAAIDLVRIAAAAYMADRLTKRRSGFSRTIELHIQVTDPARWDGLLDDTADLLFWLSGDTWDLGAQQVSTPGMPLSGHNGSKHVRVAPCLKDGEAGSDLTRTEPSASMRSTTSLEITRI